MKKSVAVIVIVVVLAGAATLALVLGHGNKSKTDTGQVAASTAGYAVVGSCKVLTSSIAGQILSGSAVKVTAPGDEESGDDIAFSNCTYNAGPDVNPSHVASVGVRSAKDSAGAASNKSAFTKAGMPADAQNVTGYGSAAYWDQSMGQLNILKGNNWYMVSNYTGTAPTDGTASLGMAEQLAQKLTLE